MKENRKTELSPVIKPLELNCDLLFSLIKEADMLDYDSSKIERILSDSGNHIFMSEYLSEKYSFNYEVPGCKAEFTGKELHIPVVFLTKNSTIKVSVTEPGSGTTDYYSDWSIQNVERNGTSVTDFVAELTSSQISDQKWSDDSKVTVEILEEDASAPFVTMAFEVEDSTSYVLWTDYTFVQVQ